MNAIVVAACIASGSFFAGIVFHLCLCRLLPNIDRLRLLVRLLPIMLACSLVATLVFQRHIELAVRNNFTTACVGFAALSLCILWVCVLSFYSAVTHSVRLHIGVLLAASPGRRRAAKDIVSLYDADDATHRRIHQLVKGGYLEQDGDLLRLTPKGTVCAAISSGGKRLFRTGPGG